MKITVNINAGRYNANVPFEGADHVVVGGVDKCPSCGRECEKETPFKVRGTGNHPIDHDTFSANAVALCCGAWVGTIRVKVDTIFGIEEDRRVLNGRCRVY